MKKSFASDNYSGVHKEIFNALLKANEGHAAAYGSDEYTARAVKLFKHYFGNDTEVYFAYNGTGANVLGLSTLTQSFNSIVCSELAHINVDESTAPEKFMGCKLLTVPTQNGKIYPDQIASRIQRVGDQHHPQAKVVSISQTTEYGTAYTIEEIKAIANVAHKHHLYFHIDGSRISNAAVSLQQEFRAFTRDAGVDVLSFGGTKNGMMFGEAVLIFNPSLAASFQFIRKQGMQLHSKMRFIGAQFEALLTNDLWKQNANQANTMAARLASGLKKLSIPITQSVDANGVFAKLKPEIIPPLQQENFFYVWNEKNSEVRLMCSFDTTEEDVDNFLQKLKTLQEK